MAIDDNAVTRAPLGVPKPRAIATSLVETFDEVAETLDDSVPVAADAANQVTVDQSLMVRWAGTVFTVCSLVLLPWTVVLAQTLPSRQVSTHYDIAWAGFDVLLFSAIAATAVLTLRRSRYLTVGAAAAGALLVADAWFDVLTAPSIGALVQAVAMSALIELPLATVCCWLALHTQDLMDKRIDVLLRRSGARN